MSADQITTVLIVLIVVLVANLALMGAVLFVGIRRRGAAAEAPIDDGSADAFGGSAEDAAVSRRVAAITDLAGPEMDDGSTGSAAAAASRGHVAEVADAGPDARAGAVPEVEPRASFLTDDDALRVLLVDRLTGLDSRIAWERTLRDEENRQARYRRPATVVVAELEGLERLAARLGPEVAERIVVAVAGTIGANARTSDRTALLGPGRFGVLLPETDEIQAVNFVERVRNVCDLWLDASAVSVRIRFGWASPGPGVDLRTARRLAEERLDRERRHPPLPPLGEPTPGASAAYPAGEGDAVPSDSALDAASPDRQAGPEPDVRGS
jgi:diguanylate cyclase (GGDEF)-like protein